MTRVCIIGAGIVGTTIAYELSHFDLEILLLEKEIEPSFGVSKSNSGIIHTGFQSNAQTTKAKLAVRGNQLYHKLVQTLNIPFRKTGELVVGTEADKPALVAMLENGKKLGIPHMKLVDSDWIRQSEPLLSPHLKWALLGKTAGVINPYEATYALADHARLNGVIFKMNTRVTGIDALKKRWLIKTESEVIESDIVINAAGLFSDDVARLAGVQTERIMPRKGEEFLLDRHAGELTQRIIFPVPKKNTKGILVIPTVDLNYMIGPTAWDTHDKFDLTTSQDGKQQVLKSVKNLVPTINENLIIASFAGLRPALPSGDFHIAEDRPGLINLVGIQSPGLTAAPAIAEWVKNKIREKIKIKKKRVLKDPLQAIPKFRSATPKKRQTLIENDPDFGEIICRCEMITKGEIKEAIRRGAQTLDGIKFRTRSQMGRCHGAFCTAKIMKIMEKELDVHSTEITKRGEGSNLCMI